MITSMVAGVDSETLPMVIYAMARRGANPVVNSISTLIVVALGIVDCGLGEIAEAMRRRTLFLMGLAGAAGCSRGRERRLNVFNWSSYVAADTIPNFEREFDVRVRYAVYESNEEMFARVMTGNSGWDVVFPTNYFIEPMREMGLLAELDHGLLRNLNQLDTPFRRPSWDPELRWCVPYMWNATGHRLQPVEAGPAPLSWRDLWGARMAGHMTMLDDPVDVFGARLKKPGLTLTFRLILTNCVGHKARQWRRRSWCGLTSMRKFGIN